MAASRALMGGDWRQAYEHVASLTVWSLLAGKQERLDLMRTKLQECGLRTYLFASGSYYQSLSLEQLCHMFELPEERVRPPHTALTPLPHPLPVQPHAPIPFCGAYSTPGSYVFDRASSEAAPGCYQSLSLTHLCHMFELPQQQAGCSQKPPPPPPPGTHPHPPTPALHTGPCIHGCQVCVRVTTGSLGDSSELGRALIRDLFN